MVIAIVATVVGVWAATKVSVSTTGSITYVAEDVYATITGEIAGAQVNPELDTLEYSATSEPTQSQLDSWKSLNLNFKQNKDIVTIQITIKNNSTDKYIKYSIADKISASSNNLSKGILGGTNGYLAPTESKTLTIRFNIIDKNKSISAIEFNYVLTLLNAGAEPPAAGYFMTSAKWREAIQNVLPDFLSSDVLSIEFTDVLPSGTGYTTVSVGATDENGTTPYVSGTAGVSDVTAYIKASSSDSTKFDIIIYCPGTIYAPVDSSSLFYDPEGNDDAFYTFYNLEILKLDNFDTSNVTNMYDMFYMCESLTSLDVSNFDTSSVTDMSFMFSGCNYLTSLDVSNFDTSSVTDMENMFSSCNRLTSLDVSNFNTSKVTDMRYMFAGFRSLTSLNLSNFDTIKVTNMSSMFSDCSGLTSLDVSNFDTSSVTDMSFMFSGCNYLTSLDVSNFDTSSVTDMENMFSSCNRLTSLDVTNFDTSKVTYMNQMFYMCESLTSLDASNFDTINVTRIRYMFYGCSKLTSLDLSNFDMSKCTGTYSTNSMLDGCSALTEIKTPKAIASGKTIDLPTGNWLNASSGEGPYTTISFSSSTLNLTLKIFSSTYTIDFRAEDPTGADQYGFSYKDGSFDNYDDSPNYSEAFDEAYPNIHGTYVTNASYIQLLPKDASVWEVEEAWGYIDGTDAIKTTIYIWGNAEYHVRIPEGYFMNIYEYNYYGVDLQNWEDCGNEYVENGIQDDYEFSLTTSPAAYKLELYVWHESKNLTPSAVTTSKLSNLHITLVADQTISNYYFGHPIPMPKVYVLGMNYSDYVLEDAGQTTSKIDGTLHVNFKSEEDIGTIVHFGVMTPITYALSIQTNTGTYNGQSGTIQVATGYAGKTFTIERSLITAPEGYYFNKLVLKNGSKGSFESGNNLSDGSSETTYIFGAGSATVELRFAKLSNASYFQRGWQQTLVDSIDGFDITNISTISFVYNKPTGSGYTEVSVGATDKTGETAWTSGSGVYNITAYVKPNSSDSSMYDVIFYSPTTIYAPVDSSYLFSSSTSSNRLTKLTSITFGNFDTSKVTDMQSMFSRCSGLTSLEVSSFNTSNVTSMWGLFAYCSGLTSLDVTNFDTSNVKYMYSMFYSCSGLTSLEVSNFDTRSVTNMQNMFSSCSSLTSLEVSNFDTRSVTNMQNMFSKCSGLTSLDLSNFDTSNVKWMQSMFSYCSGLTSLEVSSFNTSNVTNMDYMFNGCSKLTSLDLSSFDMSKCAGTSATSNMLSGCTALTEIKTPKAIASGKTIDLPTKSGYSWKDTSGNTYTTISSSNLNKTLTLVAN